MPTLLLRFGIILEKLLDRHERSGNAILWNVGITKKKAVIGNQVFNINSPKYDNNYAYFPQFGHSL